MTAILKEIFRFKELNPSLEIIGSYMKEVLKRNPTLIRYEKNKPYIYFEYDLDNGTALDIKKDQDDIYYAIRNVQMIEYNTSNQTSYKIFMNMFRTVESKNLLVSHIICGDITKLYKWLDLLNDQPWINTEPTEQIKLLGVNIYQTSELSEDVFIMCGSLSKYTLFSLKSQFLCGGFDNKPCCIMFLWRVI
jgi:hypothetical protein